MFETKFRIVFLEEAREFILKIDDKAKSKIQFTLKKAQFANDISCFKKIDQYIWEFRILFNRMQYRLFAFWDKNDSLNTLVICTHGIIKKRSKIPKKEIEKAKVIRKEYFSYKSSSKWLRN
ncbi:MAG: type II toxin-antitoxin system RelE/ParE family toxin [Bacteroidia bacterium]|nr:type II toxin-antitoxin system RelE/ParE family toxin [Bacteroidia bacterium]